MRVRRMIDDPVNAPGRALSVHARLLSSEPLAAWLRRMRLSCRSVVDIAVLAVRGYSLGCSATSNVYDEERAYQLCSR